MRLFPHSAQRDLRLIGHSSYDDVQRFNEFEIGSHVLDDQGATGASNPQTLIGLYSSFSPWPASDVAGINQVAEIPGFVWRICHRSYRLYHRIFFEFLVPPRSGLYRNLQLY